MRTRLLWTLLLTLTLSQAVQAQQIYKCVDGTQVSYQSQPCDAGARLVRQWQVPVESPVATSAPSGASKRVSRPTRTPRTGAGRSSGLRTRFDIAADRCAAAKARRRTKLQAVGLKRTFALLRKLDDEVYEACK